MNRFSIIAKIAISSILFVLCTFPSFSAVCYRISSVDSGNANVNLRYLEQTDSTSLIYAVFTLPSDVDEAVLVNIPKSMYVTDGDINYKLIAAHNVPIQDESMLEFSILEGKDRKLNFVLEFEKFPFDEKFDIIDDPTGDGALNFRGVSVDTESNKEFDRERFMASTDLPRCGQYYDSGKCTTYYIRDGVFVSFYSTYGSDHFTLHLAIVNNSDHGILFKTENISVIGHKQNKDNTEVQLPLISKSSYVSRVAQSDRYKAEQASNSNGLYEIGSAVSFASLTTPWRSLEHAGLNVLGGFIRDISNSNAKPYLAELDKTRADRTKDYLQSQSIKSGESHVGFIRVERPKKVNDFHMILHMDDYDFEFFDSIGK